MVFYWRQHGAPTITYIWNRKKKIIQLLLRWVEIFTGSNAYTLYSIEELQNILTENFDISFIMLQFGPFIFFVSLARQGQLGR